MNGYSKIIKNRVVLDNVSLLLEGGHIYGFRRKNGSGKTMLMRAICGMIRASSGEIYVDGKKVISSKAYPVSVGALIESPSFLMGSTGFENLKLLAELSGLASEKDIRLTMNYLGLGPNDKRKYKEYSLGMRQKLGIAAAVMGSPQLIVLDEPINALDEETVYKVRKMLVGLRDPKRIIVIACHDREEMDYLSDWIFNIEDGHIAGEERNEKEMDNAEI